MKDTAMTCWRGLKSLVVTLKNSGLPYQFFALLSVLKPHWWLHTCCLGVNHLRKNEKNHQNQETEEEICISVYPSIIGLYSLMPLHTFLDQQFLPMLVICLLNRFEAPTFFSFPDTAMSCSASCTTHDFKCGSQAAQ